MMPTRFITFAGSTVAIEYKGPGASRIVRFLYGDIPSGDHKPPHTTFRLFSASDSPQFELVYIPPVSLTMQTLPRPLNLKRPSRAILNRQLDFSNPSAPILSSTTTDLVPARLFNPGSKFRQPPLSLIVFPHFQAGSGFGLTPLSKAQAGLALMECLVNARNLADHGFSEITRLTRAVPAYKLSHAGFDQIGIYIEGLLEK